MVLPPLYTHSYIERLADRMESLKRKKATTVANISMQQPWQFLSADGFLLLFLFFLFVDI